MVKIAIKNMNETQAREEAWRLDAELYALRRQLWALDERSDILDKIGNRWVRESTKVAGKLLAIAKFQAPGGREIVDGLMAWQKTIFDRYELRMRQRNAIYREKDVLYAQMNKLYRRHGLVTKRRWQLKGPGRPGEIRVLDPIGGR
jgi:hypothetical protein